MAGRMVVIEHTDGQTRAVLPKDFERGIDGDYQGYHVIRWEDGEEYEGPKTAAALRKAEDPPKNAPKESPKKSGDKGDTASE